jgi:glyoxylase-like metal-dependent hydrolase (beta-lactamase superfamily II)
VPASWLSLQSALGELGRSSRDVAALVLTHAHFDHIGFAERARSTFGIPVLVHENDVPLTRHPTQYAHERARSKYLLTYPKALPCILAFARTRAFFPKRIEKVQRYVDGTLDVPGSPEVVFTPGHTLGHCALHFRDRDTLIAGDTPVTFNPYTARHGPQLVARAANADTDRARASLDAVAATGAGTVLTGHGPPWTEGAEELARQARAATVQ